MSKKDYNKVSENNLPFEEIKNGKILFRKFSKHTPSEEFHWHRDKEDRTVVALHKTNWLFQRENRLPETISGEIKIKAGEWHRVIKGTEDLEVKILIDIS